ncbi:ferredoxin [Trebonia kvetii]|uniref:Ferredoxin n=1 Tax=Trebonia kvetii TaxID=2480626 RepID=A0A6P2BT28_9ACTN|nr:ferredoxin [Trebonia kvetii]TVZ02222.1 ferredoxin [Trebonia kvetii]
MTAQRTVKVDRNLCVGTGLCADIAPAAFMLVAGKSQAGDAGSVAVDDLADAVASCPTSAISVWDEDGNEVDLA